MKIVLIRHGESEWNKLNLFTGWTDVELSDQGVIEAREAGRKMLEAGLDFDVCYTSYLKRAIGTLNLALSEMDRLWLPVVKDWRLNERHYGALQGLNKVETIKQYGEEQVKIWRRSFDTPPPKLDDNDSRHPKNQQAYRNLSADKLPTGESLKSTIERVLPYFNQEIKPKIIDSQRVLIVAHGNSIRALVKAFEGLSDDEIVSVEIPTGVPLIYELNEDFKVISKHFLASDGELEAKISKNQPTSR